MQLADIPLPQSAATDLHPLAHTKFATIYVSKFRVFLYFLCLDIFEVYSYIRFH